MVDALGQMALLSLLTKQFQYVCPDMNNYIETWSPLSAATVSLKAPPVYLQSTIDGSCLLIGRRTAQQTWEIHAFHLASFGSDQDGTLVDIGSFNADGQLSISSIQDHSSCALKIFDPLSLRLTWIPLKITSNMSEYSFQSSDDFDGQRESTSTSFLLYCFAEIWNRFPIVPTIERRRSFQLSYTHSISFVAPRNHEFFIKTFKNQMQEFARTTYKPMADRFSSTIVTASDSITSAVSRSSFTAGDWLASLFCLIPIQIAITQSNTFVPLKDGYRSSTFEDSILGANVEHVANSWVMLRLLFPMPYIKNSLSLGWYESIFSSYLAKKVGYW